MHGVAGVVGSILTGEVTLNGKFMNQMYATIGIVIAVAIITYIISMIVFVLCKGQMRYDGDEELIGLDIVEHGEELE